MKTCCHGKPAHHSAFSMVLSKVVDAHFELCRYVTHKSIDCIEGLLCCHEHNSCCSHYDRHPPSCGCKEDMCCEIPEPCWMPKFKGEYCCEVSEGGKVSLTLWIANEDFKTQTYRFSRRGDAAGRVEFSETEVTLQAKERAKVIVTFEAPKQPASCKQSCYDLVIWIDSCRDYYLRWNICTSQCPKPCCVESFIDDVPDYVVHWYDHFYCYQRC